MILQINEILQVRERMTYVGSVLEEFVELDEQVVSIKWNLDCNKYPTLTPDKSAMPVSTNPPLPPSESSTSKYFLKDFRKIWTKVSRFAYLWLCVFLRLSELPNFGSLKIFHQPIPCKTYQGKQNIMWWGIFNIYLNLNVIRSYLA